MSRIFVHFVLELFASKQIQLKLSCHVFPHSEGHSFHDLTMRVSWPPATRKVSEMSQSSLTFGPKPSELRAPLLPFLNPWGSGTWQTLRSGVLSAHHSQPLEWRCITSEVAASRLHYFNSDVEASWNPLGKQRGQWAPSPSYWPGATARQHSIVKIKIEITLTYVILHKGNLFRCLE